MFARIAVIDRRLKRMFWWLGTVVGRHYRLFLILPVILSVIASTGLLQELVQLLFTSLFPVVTFFHFRYSDFSNSGFPVFSNSDFKIFSFFLVLQFSLLTSLQFLLFHFSLLQGSKKIISNPKNPILHLHQQSLKKP
jgi:hypothetical protein